MKLWAVIGYYYTGINIDGYCFKDSTVMDGRDGMYAVKLTSFGALEFVANENTLGNEYVHNNII